VVLATTEIVTRETVSFVSHHEHRQGYRRTPLRHGHRNDLTRAPAPVVAATGAGPGRGSTIQAVVWRRYDASGHAGGHLANASAVFAMAVVVSVVGGRYRRRCDAASSRGC
jgi:hypothetical protein